MIATCATITKVGQEIIIAITWKPNFTVRKVRILLKLINNL